MNGRVCVLLPVRDNPTGLHAAIESLRLQSFADWTCIVLDDGSRVRLDDLIGPFGDPRLSVHRCQSSGLTAVLQEGLALTSSDYVARLDSDDIALKERFGQQIEFLDSHLDVLALGTGAELVSDTGRILGSFKYPSSHEAICAELDRLLTPLPHSSLMYRRDALRLVGGYRPRFVKAQDYDLLLRLSESGRLASLPEPLVRLTVTRSSVTASPIGGEQFEFGVLAYACAVIRRLGHDDPLLAANAEEFYSCFKAWYRSSGYPAIFRSRLERRSARIALSEMRPGMVVSSLARATWADPAWPFLYFNCQFTQASAVRSWAEGWARRKD